MTQLVLSALLPVFLLIAAGFVAARKELVRPMAVKDLSNLVFLLLAPALFFRTMSQVHVQELDFRPVAACCSPRRVCRFIPASTARWSCWATRSAR